jgi:hypothetical protein
MNSAGDPCALGQLLRARRERLSPQDVGLPPGTRRRTAGLRREEVAALANVSATYYTFLEQGRPGPAVRAGARCPGHGAADDGGRARLPAHPRLRARRHRTRQHRTRQHGTRQHRAGRGRERPAGAGAGEPRRGRPRPASGAATRAWARPSTPTWSSRSPTTPTTSSPTPRQHGHSIRERRLESGQQWSIINDTVISTR